MNASTLFIIYYDPSLSGVTQKIQDIVNYTQTQKRFCHIVIIFRRRGSYPFYAQQKYSKASVYYYSDTALSRFAFCFPLYVYILTLRHKPNRMLAFCYMPSLAASIVKFLYHRQIKLVVSIAEDYYGLEKELHYNVLSIRKLLLAFIQKHADIYIALNKALQAKFVGVYGFSHNNIRLAHNWYSTKSALPKATPMTARINLVYIGRLEYEKNILSIIRSVQTLICNGVPAYLSLVGAGDAEHSLKQFVQKNNLPKNVVFTGYTQHPEEHLHSTSIYLSPSANEGTPMAMLDAMSYGLVVVSAAFPGVDEVIVHGKTGYIFDTDQELIDIITFLSAHPRIQKRIGQHARLFIKKYYSRRNMLGYVIS